MYWVKKKSLAKVIIWLTTEILFNFVGIDDIADYSEFVFENNSDKNASKLTIIIPT